MEFLELTEEEFSCFSLTHKFTSFHQTIEWGKLKEKTGWKYYPVGVKEGNKIIAATLLLEKKLFLNFSLFYSPRGFLINYEDKKCLEFFTNELKKYIKRKHAIFLKIDPYCIHLQRDIDGNIVEGGIDNTIYVENLKQLGYKHSGFNLGSENLQPRWAVTLSLTGKTIDEIYANMEPKTRQMINRNNRIGLKIRELNETEIEEFKKIMSHTSNRRNFIDRPFSYYKNMVDCLKDKTKIVVCEINLKNYIETMKNEFKENDTNIKQKQNDIDSGKKININKTQNKIKEWETANRKLSEKIEKYEKYLEEDGEIVTLGGIIYMIYAKEVLSLFGGAYAKYMDLLSPYTTNFEMIKYAVENGYEKYNFYGIEGHFEDKKSELYGLYDFKRGFGGVVEEYIGEFDFIVSKPLYLCYKVALKLYNFLKRVKNK